MKKFFVSTPLGFEHRALSEMRAIWPYLLGKDAQSLKDSFPSIEMTEGGFEFEADFFVGPQLNFFLKSANRVLLRLDSFRCRDFPKLFTRTRDLPWSEFITDSNVEWVVAAQGSRLNNEKRLQDCMQDAIKETMGAPKSQEPQATVYVRMFDDQLTISLDTTGEHLHKRGWSVLKGEAPLRETIASYMIEEMIGDAAPETLSQISLKDPFVGSGTLLTEARALYTGAFARPYAFQKWKRAPKLFLSPSFALNYKLPVIAGFKEYLGSDIDAEMILVAEKNFAEVEKQMQAVQKKNFTSAKVTFEQQDALAEGTIEHSHPLWLVCNPPYGERLPLAASGGLAAVVKRLCERYKPQKLGILYPQKDGLKTAPNGYKVVREVSISNGGLHTSFTVIESL
jgi:Predicted N6-adenine-specific DNA methylase